jgi:hypothetical protein
MKILNQLLIIGLSMGTILSLSQANAETVSGGRGILDQLNNYTSDYSPQAIAKEVKDIRNYMARHPKSALPYAYINKRAKNGAFTTYLVDVKTGKVKDTFPSLIGYNGIGCGTGQSRPGIFKLTTQKGVGLHRKAWWGNNKQYYDIANVPGGSRCGEHLDVQVIAHSNVNVPNVCTAKVIRSRSAGCFTTSPDKWDKMKEFAGKAYIYNVE